jgi:hypothetical protein
MAARERCLLDEHHAVELFLKACIVNTSPNDNIGHHNVARPQQRFIELQPTIEPLEIMWDWRMRGILTDQLFRYGADKTGATLDGEELAFAPREVDPMDRTRRERLSSDLVRDPLTDFAPPLSTMSCCGSCPSQRRRARYTRSS